MGKTIRNEKGCGFEYWSRRNYKDMTKPGRISKKITSRAARRITKNKLKGEQDG